jgi:alpha-galactosidase
MKSSLGAEKKDQEIVLRVERIPTISSVKSVDVKSAVQISGGKRSRKISFLGAGSLVFTKSLLTDILSFPELQSDSVLCLEDIDQKRLDLMLRYFKKYQEDNISVLKDITIESTTNQRKAITDSRYVISAIQAGGLDAYTIDMDIPQKYGVYQVVGDSLGPGGVFRFLRTVPIFETILNDIAEVGEQGQPNGSKPYFFNYTNPMAMNTWYANIIATDSTVGLCHGVQGTAQLLKRWIGAITPGEFSYLCAGINHMAWFLKLWFKDPSEDPLLKGPWKDAYPLIWEHFKEEPEMTHEEKVRIDMMKATGFFMTESSGHLAEYLPYYLKRKDLIAKYKSEKGQGFETLEQSNYLKSNLEKLGRMESEFEHSFQLEKLNFKSTHSDEYCANIIHSLETGQLFQFNGNIMNKHGGLITNLPADCCVEVPITVDHMGLHPQGGIELPPICQGLCMSNIMVQHAAVKGALYRRRDLINHAVMLDPNTASILAPEEIKQMVDDLFKAQKKWLPAGFYSNY